MNTADQSGADERAKFEAWCASQGLDATRFENRTDEINGEYWYQDVLIGWKAWQAALASTQPAPQAAQEPIGMNVDKLAALIRRVDGNNNMGAGALAEALFPHLSPIVATVPSGWKDIESAPMCVDVLVRTRSGTCHIAANHHGTWEDWWIHEINAVEWMLIPDTATPQPFPAPAVQSGDVLEVLKLSTHALHVMPDGHCKCSQCDFVRARDALLASAAPSQGAKHNG